MEKKQIENILIDLLSTGGDFAEVFLEERNNKTYQYIDNRLDELKISDLEGIGLRLAKEDNIYYGSTNDLKIDSLNKLINTLKNNVNDKVIYENVKLSSLKTYSSEANNKYSDIEIKNKFNEINNKIRKKDKRITQVTILLKNDEQKVTIANQSGVYSEENRLYTRFFIKVNFRDGEKCSDAYYSKALNIGNAILDEVDYDKVIERLIKEGIDKLYAKPCLGRVMPVVISNGFGGVIFHEACGHALEATSVADKISVLSNDFNKKIATDKVTLIDDGTIENGWGSTKIDDEGNQTQKNILIENGILKSYLIDELNNRKMKQKITGSGRRQNYNYAPTSRMNNTYLAPGTDKIEDMIKSIDLGLYAKTLGGGQVSTETGEFNFACDTAYMIRNGKIAECVKSASLIGNTKDILNEIEMVADDLELSAGVCGSLSGNVPVNNGQPTIKVGHILVGGEASE